jgi:hypothetical protein
MSRSFLSRGAVVPALLVGLALPSAALAAPSSRSFGVGVDGDPVAVNGVVGITPDAGQVMFSSPPSGATTAPAKTLLRDLRTNTTTSVLPPEDFPRSASSDLHLVLFQTTTALSPNDLGGGGDFYLLNRTTGAFTLVSRTASGAAMGDVDQDQVAFLSADGNTVLFDSKNAGNPQVLRFNVGTGAITALPAQSLARNQKIDTAGGAVVTNVGVIAGGKTWFVPANTDNQHDHRVFVLSPDGFTLAEQHTDNLGGFAVTDLKTGKRRLLPYVVDATNTGAGLLGVANGGASLTLSAATPISDSASLEIIDHLSTTTGNVTQIGQPLPSDTNGSASGNKSLTPGESFVATAATVTALGSAPVPGGPLATPAAGLAVNHLSFYSGCLWKSWYQPAISPSFVLSATSPTDAAKATGASVTLFNVDTGAATSTIALKPGVRASLGTGGAAIRYDAHVTFADGTIGSRFANVDANKTLNDVNLLTGRGTCKTANAL